MALTEGRQLQRPGLRLCQLGLGEHAGDVVAFVRPHRQAVHTRPCVRAVLPSGFYFLVVVGGSGHQGDEGLGSPSRCHTGDPPVVLLLLLFLFLPLSHLRLNTHPGSDCERGGRGGPEARGDVIPGARLMVSTANETNGFPISSGSSEVRMGWMLN